MSTSRARGRRRGVVLVIAAALALTGCAGGDAAEPGAAAESGDLLPAAEGKTQYPLTLASPFGETVLEERPERIAIVSAPSMDSDAVFALGVTPVFAPSTIERNVPWLTPEQIESVETRWESGSDAEVGIEQVAAAEPDLIVALFSYDSVDQARFDQLRSVAPVLYANGNDTLSWRDMTERLGQALDLNDAAERVAADFDAHMAGLRSAHPEFVGKTAAFVMVYEEEYGPAYFSTPGDNSALLFEQLGFVLPDAASQFVESSDVSNEMVGLIDADFLLLGASDDPSYFLDAPLVQQVPAIRDGRYTIVPSTDEANLPWALASGSALSLMWASTTVADHAASVLT